MEKRYKTLSLFEFQTRFADEDKCKAYLATLKWGNGYTCAKCGHGKYCGGLGVYD
ncbi:MAG: ISXO2-like transposase protein, partial [Adhaeribacter sp.]|nr:ISXO2-like transposase protein [Adhaeribacter sp.]